MNSVICSYTGLYQCLNLSFLVCELRVFGDLLPRLSDSAVTSFAYLQNRSELLQGIYQPSIDSGSPPFLPVFSYIHVKGQQHISAYSLIILHNLF